MTEIKLSCGCYARRGIVGGYVIEASAFLCPRRHEQGNLITDEDEAYARSVDAEWDRAEAEWLEQK